MYKHMRSFIGTKKFYMMVFAITAPIIVQNAITNFVNLLDNLMVGRLGTEQMSGVAIANQLFYVFNITIFGVVSGPGLFSAQFHGAGNTEGVRSAFRYKLYIGTIVTAAVIAMLGFYGRNLVMLYMKGETAGARIEETLQYALEYLRIMLIGLFPFMLVQCYASTLRETGKTSLPMFAGMSAVGVNLLFNYLLIFGKFGFPKLGILGAAYATVLSRFVELAVIVGYTHTHTAALEFAEGLYKHWSIPLSLVKKITITGSPLLANELLWSLGQTSLMQTYSLRGLDVVAAMNISGTVNQLFMVAFLSMGIACAILIGQALGAGDIACAKDRVKKMLTLSVMTASVIAVILIILAPLIPTLYNTGETVRKLASDTIIAGCVVMPCIAFVNCCYFIIRSGGKTGITFMFDSGFAWVVCVPVARLLVSGTGMDIVYAYACVQACEAIKAVIGAILLKKGIWIHNIVESEG